MRLASSSQRPTPAFLEAAKLAERRAKSRRLSVRCFECRLQSDVGNISTNTDKRRDRLASLPAGDTAYHVGYRSYTRSQANNISVRRYVVDNFYDQVAYIHSPQPLAERSERMNFAFRA